MELDIRDAGRADRAAARSVHEAAFEGREEADLVEALTEAGAGVVSLVAVLGGEVVGHVLFTSVTIDCEEFRGAAVGLAPMAVAPKHQREGVGSALARAGLEACRESGQAACVVLGHPAYYPRFGFRPAHELGLSCAFPAPPEAFMVLELQPGALDGARGRVDYHAAFGAA